MSPGAAGSLRSDSWEQPSEGRDSPQSQRPSQAEHPRVRRPTLHKEGKVRDAKLDAPRCQTPRPCWGLTVSAARGPWLEVFSDMGSVPGAPCSGPHTGQVRTHPCDRIPGKERIPAPGRRCTSGSETVPQILTRVQV